MIEVGSKVKSLLSGIHSNIIGVVLSHEGHDVYGKILEIQIESSSYYRTGRIIDLYEKDVELIRTPIDHNSKYQYCIKCDTLTYNKIKNIYICCDHKQ